MDIEFVNMKFNEIPDEIKQEAKKNPGGWVYVIDKNYHQAPNQGVPPTAIVGAWKVDDFGLIEGDFLNNPNHVPL